jgi:hypothetical protein
VRRAVSFTLPLSVLALSFEIDFIFIFPPPTQSTRLFSYFLHADLLFRANPFYFYDMSEVHALKG